jgi:hypothetical protein
MEGKDFLKEWSQFLGVQGDPWDWDSFKWGMLAGGIAVVAVEGVILYFAWPYIIEFLFGTQAAKAVSK